MFLVVSETFHVDQEDLVDGTYQNSNKQNTAILTQPSVPSQPLDFMFIEKKGEVCLFGYT